jgi:Flp pilus assembly protein TadD
MPNNHDEGEIVEGLLQEAEGALARGVVSRAVALYQGILAVDQRQATALRQLAVIALDRGQTVTALDLFRRAIDVSPRDPDLYHGVGTALRLKGRKDEAAAVLQTALMIDPTHPPALHDLAMLLQEKGNLDAAGELFRRLAVHDTTRCDALFKRAVVLFHQDRLVEAERWFHAAAECAPDDPRPIVNLAMIYRIMDFVPEAIACLEHAVKISPEMPEANWNLAHARLALGDLERGFAGYEWRFRREGFAERHFPLPRWRGEPVAGRTILLTAEQGLGDAIQFARFAAPLAARGARVLVECLAGLESLIATVPGVAGVLPWSSGVGDADLAVPLLSVPHLLGTALADLSGQVPYMTVPPATVAPAITGPGLKVGLAWRGNPHHGNDHRRSVALDTFAPLLDVPGIDWYALQVGPGRPEQFTGPWAGRITDLAPRMKDFAISAAIVSQLDLVITVDTAMAHLVGALGRPGWVLLCRGNDWRWLHERQDSPWYPSLRLFRQRPPRDWRPALAAMADELRVMAVRATAG